MKYRVLQLQRGFLLIVAVVLIAIVAVIGLMLDYMFIGNITATTNVLQADQALYIATSGLEMAKRDMLARSKTCAYINTTYNNPHYLFQGHVNSPNVNGEFTVVCNSMPSGTLPANISATSTTIQLPSSVISGLSSSGFISIDGEIINFSGKSGNYILNARRGISGTIATIHTTGAPVNNNAYILTATGGVPNIAGAEGKRNMRQQVFFGTSGSNLFNLPGGFTPAVTVGGGNVGLQGSASITNNSCNGSPGCSLLSGGEVDFNGSFSTNNGTSCGGSHCVPGADIVQNYSGLIPDNFYSYFFGNKTIADFNPTTINNISSLGANSSGAYLINSDVKMNSSKTYFTTSTPTVLIINGDLKINGSVTMGSISGPVLLLVLGNIDINGSVSINGFVYIDNELDVSGSSSVNGAIAAKGAEVTLTGSASVNFNAPLLGLLGFGGGATVVSSPEVF